MRLVKYRDAGMSTYTYFWVNESERLSSPFFDSEKDALDWIDNERNTDTIPAVHQTLPD